MVRTRTPVKTMFMGAIAQTQRSRTRLPMQICVVETHKHTHTRSATPGVLVRLAQDQRYFINCPPRATTRVVSLPL